ncbi:SH2 domain-containing protein B-like isoform X2 [Rhododendron vialii]|nr:SH2 domain-containing protein B-like isoform X2 [Rhododendron vialii]
MDNSPSDSESIEARNSNFKSTLSNRSPVSDTAIFKYCLGGLNERALLLKEVATAASEKELADFARQVSLYLGCSHHGRQVMLAKRLVEEGTKAWDLISQNNPHVIWENVVAEINNRFMKIACSSTRSLTLQDFEILRRIAGCQEFVARENFEKMWCWLYPVAFTLSGVWVNAMWNSASPKWIDGFITKEEAESSLQGAGVLQEPGTFVLRFPTSRSWPHPDAGNLVATYIGSDYNIHHRLLSLDFIFSSGEKEMSSRPLQDMLLAQPELSRLGRIIRSH